VPLGAGEGGRSRLDLSVQPWSSVDLKSFSAATLDEPVRGHAIREGETLRLEVEVPPTLRGRHFMVCLRTGDGKYFAEPAACDPGGSVRASLDPRTERANNRWLPLHVPFHV